MISVCMAMRMVCEFLVVRLLLFYGNVVQKRRRNERDKKGNEQIDPTALFFVDDDLRSEAFARDRVRFIYVKHGMVPEQ